MHYFTIFCISLFAIIQSPLFSIEQGFIEDPNRPSNRIEFFFSKPNGEGPFPVIFLLHGYQPPEQSNGGRQLVEIKYTDNFLNEGILPVSISIPGFGNSTGKRDFFGPDSQKAVAAVIAHFKNEPYVDSSRMGLYGISRGADTAAMVSSFCPDISLQILESGMYDLKKVYYALPQHLQDIRDCIKEESGITTEDFEIRSAVLHTDTIKASTLLLHGQYDCRRGLLPARRLHELLLQHHVDSRLVVYSNGLHCLTGEKWSPIISFVREKFFNLYGIGIELEKISQVNTIKAVRSNSSAERTQKLKIADVILRISPNNNAAEMNALDMPVTQLIRLILGKKGTSIRLYVQHFDQSYEDIVVERNN